MTDDSTQTRVLNIPLGLKGINVNQSFAGEHEIWVLEDDKGCTFLYQQVLDIRYKTRYFSTIKELCNALEELSEPPSNTILIADLILPDGSFLDFLSSDIDFNIDRIPFIVISSVDDIDALRFCFKEGAFDYLTKPFKKSELLVKIENKFSGVDKPNFSHEDINTISFDGIKIKGLTTKEMQLLALFLNSLDREVRREDSLKKAWGGTAVHPKTLDVHLYNLRKKLAPYGYVIKSEGRGRWTLVQELESKV